MVLAWIFAGWCCCVGLGAAWLWFRLSRPRPAGRPAAADPFAGQVARFRRDLHDWDRNGRP